MTCRVHGYQLEFEQDEYGGWIVTVPDIPCCISYGESVANAKVNITMELDEYLASIHAAGDTDTE